jgi:CDP-diacylglycerol--glycerol-3-phosphate 3-phosphatidyltransferase
VPGLTPPVLPDRDAYLTRWSALHGGYDPRGSRLVRTWLGWTYAVARPLARTGVAPDLLTLLGGMAAAGVVALAALGGRWAAAAAAVVVLSGFTDNVDGAVAVLTDRATRWGYVLDSLADRVADALYLVALWVLGAPAAVCVLGGALMGLQEYARARAGAAGLDEVAVVTVWERPTRVIVTALFLLGAGLHVDSAATWVAAGAAAWAGFGVVGLTQLLVVLRRRLR